MSCMFSCMSLVEFLHHWKHGEVERERMRRRGGGGGDILKDELKTIWLEGPHRVCWLTFVLQICSWSTAWSHLILLWKISMFCTVLLLRGYSFQGACVTQGFNVSSYGKCSRCCFNARLPQALYSRQLGAVKLVLWRHCVVEYRWIASSDVREPIPLHQAVCSCPTLSKDPAYCRTGM